MISVEVVFALPEMQVLESVDLRDGASVQDAIDASGLREKFPQEQLDALRLPWTRAKRAVRGPDRVPDPCGYR
jgi:putative ubiquitin-RnfH superfamily antitoxin RatB of RatAB toxin-antitoxin module